MREAIADLWTLEADYRCITTNGAVKKNGEAVMGRGCAKEAADRWPLLPEMFGTLIAEFGNHVQAIGYSVVDGELQHCAWDVIAFPVKHHWKQKADLELIERSARELVGWLDSLPDNYNKTVVIPRPGCGNGGLEWDEVKPVIEPILDDRFVVVTK